ncbi:diaminobutyrate acetyltransferase [Parasalinivibrio latis]|uniref:diaminobutyrate acetyltransferase n=1 Tax=Parasalinivibrio latis TaxID=2952610 RepID=UPI0030E013CC
MDIEITNRDTVAEKATTAITSEITLRKPKKTDGTLIYELIKNSPPLDVNSSYCNFLQAIHFKDTCIVAEQGNKICGFISGYLQPEDSETLFVWQVAIASSHRGQGLAYKMLDNLLNRKEVDNVRFVETTITEDNPGSWALFKKLDSKHTREGKVSLFLDESLHFQGKHDSEYLFRIPIAR